MKKLALVATLAAATLSLATCGGEKEPTVTPSTPTQTEESLKSK